RRNRRDRDPTVALAGGAIVRDQPGILAVRRSHHHRRRGDRKDRRRFPQPRFPDHSAAGGSRCSCSSGRLWPAESLVEYAACRFVDLAQRDGRRILVDSTPKRTVRHSSRSGCSLVEWDGYSALRDEPASAHLRVIGYRNRSYWLGVEVALTLETGLNAR